MTILEERPAAFAAEDRRTRELVRDLHVVRRDVYWKDLLLTAVVSWTAFGFTVYLKPFSAGMIISALIAVFGLYRALCFIHEISHHTSRSLPGFEGAWNALVGFPLLIPSSVYTGVHQSHHSLSTYGTIADPEYLPFARNHIMTVVFALQSFLIPVILVIRFLVFTPLAFLYPPFFRWLVIHLSSLTMNVAYRRQLTPELMSKVRRQNAWILCLWSALAILAYAGYVPWRFFPIWLGISSIVSFINTLRTLGAHDYESEGNPLDREGQLADSIDTPGAVWTELWAPVGLRFHALHHYFPGVPYHALPEAWRRLSASLPASATYRQVQNKSLAYSLTTLYRKGRTFRRG